MSAVIRDFQVNESRSLLVELTDVGGGCVWCGMMCVPVTHDGYAMHDIGDNRLVHCLRDTSNMSRRRQ